MTKAVGQPGHLPCKQAHNFLGMSKLTIQKHNYHPLAENSWLTEKHLSLWQEATDCSITLVFRTTTCASMDRLKTANRAIKGFSFIFRVYCLETTVHDQQLKRWKSVTRLAPQICPFLCELPCSSVILQRPFALHGVFDASSPTCSSHSCYWGPEWHMYFTITGTFGHWMSLAGRRPGDPTRQCQRGRKLHI